MRFTQAHVDEWREQGFVIIPGFFDEAEISPVRADYESIYGSVGEGDGTPLDKKEDGALGAPSPLQFKNIDTLPYAGGAEMNLISLHPELIAFARALLDAPQVHCYQSHTWAKYTGEADYDQGFHCDFGNHTLTVPSDEPRLRTVDFIFYLTDVTDAHGALHYVTKPDAYELLGEGAVFVPPERQWDLQARERSAAGQAGTLVAHGIDTFHRGTNLTAPNGKRFTMTVGYKAAGNDMIAFHIWQSAANRPWDNVLNAASPEQLECLGIPRPGSPFWSERTLAFTQQRWPKWDMTRYFEAAGVARSQAG
tara:strand:- start:1081 stop:2004 length:924 start_codon:yes stop_codon:yes gene_type:complete